MSYKNVKYNAYRDRKKVSRPPGNLIETALRSATSYRNSEHFLNHSRVLMLRNSHLLYFWLTKRKIVNRYRAGDLSWLLKATKAELVRSKRLSKLLHALFVTFLWVSVRNKFKCLLLISMPDYNVSILVQRIICYVQNVNGYTHKYCKLAKPEKTFSVKFRILFPFKYLQNNKEETKS